MPAERILETRSRLHSLLGFLGLKARIDLTLHCSCGEDYRVQEKLPQRWGTHHYTRPATCPGCNGKSYIRHTLSRTTPNGFDFDAEYVGSLVEI